ncbi:hypothetical protein PG989_003657 [Apiospora arundinis]
MLEAGKEISSNMSTLEGLPRELLLQILKEFAQNPENDLFFPEAFLGDRNGIPNQTPAIQTFPGAFLVGRNGIPNQTPAIQMFYKHCKVTQNYCTHVLPDQKLHALAWLILNTTCPIFRALAAEVFVKTRTFTMDMRNTKALEDGKLPSPLSEMSQWLDLSKVERVAFLGDQPSRPRLMLSLPRRLKAFDSPNNSTARKEVTCYPATPYSESGIPGGLPNTNATSETVANPNVLALESDLTGLLRDAGMPKEFHFKISTPDALYGIHTYAACLQSSTRKWLLVKAKSMKAGAAAATTDKES